MENVCFAHGFFFIIIIFEEQLVGIAINIYIAKPYKSSGTIECLVLRHSGNTAEKCLPQAVYNTCESSEGYRFLKSVLLLDVIVTARSIIISLLCFNGCESRALEIIPSSV